MNIDAVPQEGHIILGNHRKALYAKTVDGRMVLVISSGWHVEEIVRTLLIDTMAAKAEIARQRVINGLSSTLEYWMYARRMDVQWLARSSGVWKWQLIRHLNPKSFSRLSIKRLMRYADALGVSVDELRRFPHAKDGMSNQTKRE